MKTQTNYSVSILTDDLTRPWGMDFLPDGRIIVSERPGTIRIVSRDGGVSSPLEGVPPVRDLGVGGLLDVKLAPDFAESRLVFWTYAEPASDGSGVNVVARGRLSAGETALEHLTVIYRTSPPYRDVFHFGSRMLFADDGSLYVTLGDRFEDSVRVRAQELHSPLGKIIRINQDGTPAHGNPFSSTAGVLEEIWSLGHRNPQGLAINPATGELWESEHGPRGGDEINVVRPGANYGWPVISYGLDDDGEPVGGTGVTQEEGMEQPVYYWDPSIAPSGMTFYLGELIPEWNNSLSLARYEDRTLLAW